MIEYGTLLAFGLLGEKEQDVVVGTTHGLEPPVLKGDELCVHAATPSLLRNARMLLTAWWKFTFALLVVISQMAAISAKGKS
jgi:hypothetical protein